MSTDLPAISATQAIETIKTQFPGEAAVLHAAISKDIRALGTDEVFALRDSQGEIRAFKQNLTLSLAAGTLVQPVPGGPSVISAQGYEVWAETVGASVIFPKEVLVDGQWQPNPSVIRDPQNRRILAIYARAVAFRFSPKGLPMVCDWTTIFDTPSYRLIDLLGKAKKYPQAFRLYPADMGKPEDPGTWASYPFDESTSLWVNTAHEEALTWFAQILNREKKAIDFAQTFARRNSMKHLSGLQKAPGQQWTLPVLCWRPTSGNIIKWDASQYAQLQERVGGLIEGNTAEFIEIKNGAERVGDEEGFEVLERETDPEDQAEVIEVERQEPEPPPSPKREPRKEATKRQPPADDKLPEDYQKILGNYQAAMKMFPEEYAFAVQKLGLTPTVTSRSYSLMKEILAEINAQVEEGELA